MTSLRTVAAAALAPLIAASLMMALAPAATAVPTANPTSNPTANPTATLPVPHSVIVATTARGPQLSGASGDGVPSGAFGRWRGAPATIGGTWNDSYAAQTTQWSVQRGGEWATWNRDLDVAVGAIYTNRGQTWAAAARGAYDSRWRAALNALKSGWGSRTGTLHLRFAHEFNGTWVPWAVRGSDAANFIAAWRRFRALQKQILPHARLVFCPNDGSSVSLGLDWRRAFPGRAYVDEMSVDSYNQYPFVTSTHTFNTKALSVDRWGAPSGLETHRRFAQKLGLPLAISEWSSNSAMGDGAAFVRSFRAWVAAHAGRAPGQVPYEIFFNVGSYNGGVFRVYPRTSMPRAAATYTQLF